MSILNTSWTTSIDGAANKTLVCMYFVRTYVRVFENHIKRISLITTTDDWNIFTLLLFPNISGGIIFCLKTKIRHYQFELDLFSFKFDMGWIYEYTEVVACCLKYFSCSISITHVIRFVWLLLPLQNWSRNLTLCFIRPEISGLYKILN